MRGVTLTHFLLRLPVILAVCGGLAWGQFGAVRGFLSENEHSRILGERNGWEVDAVMPDETRCDLLSKTHAIEVEWAGKWKESVGQATLYAIWTGRKPKVLLLVKNRSREKLDILRCRLVCERLGIEMETMKAIKAGEQRRNTEENTEIPIYGVS